MSRRDRSPTRAQLSSRLAYEKKVPAFLQKLQNKYGGGYRGDNDEDDPQVHCSGDEGEGEGDFDEFGRERRREPELDEFGREVRPREREPIPERPADDPGSADEDNDDEKPQVVVLREGKHLTEREAENIRRKGVYSSSYVLRLLIQGLQRKAFHLYLTCRRPSLKRKTIPRKFPRPNRPTPRPNHPTKASHSLLVPPRRLNHPTALKTLKSACSKRKLKWV